MLHRNSHAMDDKSQVMFTNLRNESRISERETIEEAVCAMEHHAVDYTHIDRTGVYLLVGTPRDAGPAPAEQFDDNVSSQEQKKTV
jgi:hypothetical protein